MGAQWLSGRVLDSRPRGHGFKPQRRRCVVSLSKNINPSLVLVQPRKTRPFITEKPGRVAQSVTCLATDACLTADPGVGSSIPARYHTFVEIDHEIISTVILLPSADLFKKGCCQLQAKVCAQITG